MWSAGQGCHTHPGAHRALSPQTQNYPAPNLSSAEVEKPDLGVLTLQLTLFLGVARAGLSPACSSSCMC